MRLATMDWRGETSAWLVAGDAAAAVRTLPGRSAAADVLAVISSPLSTWEVDQLRDRMEPLEGHRLLPPIMRPPKNVLCVGKNYVEHVREGAFAEGSKFDVPRKPIWFSKPHTALVGHQGEVELDPAFTTCLDYEGELAVVIGSAGRRIPRDRALDHVYGYTILNDITARDRQQERTQWLKGKSADTFAPCGPWIVTADEVPDPQTLGISTAVNGEVRQADNTKNMIFDIPTLIADISEAVTLEPGDLIATGTPKGVAWGMPEPRYLQPGDEVVVEIEAIGRLRNRIVTVA